MDNNKIIQDALISEIEKKNKIIEELESKLMFYWDSRKEYKAWYREKAFYLKHFETLIDLDGEKWKQLHKDWELSPENKELNRNRDKQYKKFKKEIKELINEGV